MLSVQPANGHGPSAALDVMSYEVVLDLTRGTDTFWSRTRIRFRCQRAGAAVVADLHPVSIRQIALNGTHLSTGGLKDGRLELPRLADENTFAVEAEFAYAPLRYYERTLGVPYPYGKCDLVFVPGFPALAFSAPGLITAQDTVLQARERQPAHYLAAAIAHELAHAWFGGLVGMRRRDDTWLIEAITTYLSRAALAETRPGTAPWAAATSATLPDHAYAGDAAAIRQLETLIGRRAVMLGLGSLLRRHPHGAATKDDLVRCWSQATGRDLRTWAAETLIPATRPEDRSTG